MQKKNHRVFPLQFFWPPWYLLGGYKNDYLVHRTYICAYGNPLAIIELHPIDVKVANDIFIGRWKWIAYVINAYLFHDVYLMYVVEAFLAVGSYIIVLLYKFLLYKGFDLMHII